jgi:hypothetical protein
MSEDKLARLLNRFCAAAMAHHEALEVMNEERANTHALMIVRLYEYILSEGPAGKAGLHTLLENDSQVVAGMAAVFLLNDAPALCLPVLRELSAEPGLLGFRASVALERWETGTWEHPGK